MPEWATAAARPLLRLDPSSMAAVNHGFTVLRRRAWISLACRAVLCSAVVGACVTIGLSWMAAWDESVPSPQGLAQYRFVYDADAIGSGESGESRPAPLRWWTALTPRSWHVGPRVWADRDIEAERAANPEISLEAEDDQGRLWCVVWRAGPGLSDSFFVRRFTFVPSPQGGPDEITWAELSNYLDFGGDVRVRTGLPSGVPAALVGRGTPRAARFFTETQAEWESARLPGGHFCAARRRRRRSGSTSTLERRTQMWRVALSGVRAGSRRRRSAPTAGRFVAWWCADGAKTSSGTTPLDRPSSTRTNGGLTAYARFPRFVILKARNSRSPPPAFRGSRSGFRSSRTR